MKNRSGRLRRRLAVPLTAAFALLWLGTMLLLTNAAADRLEQEASLQYQSARETLEEQWGYYENNLAKGLGAQADHIMMYNLSSAALGLTQIDEGGMAFLARDEAGNEIRSQLAFGYGHEISVDVGQRWHLYFDNGLDDAGQIRLARWIVEHRSGWDFSLYPPDAWLGETALEEGNDLGNYDGTYARVTGIERPGCAVDVQKIELVHPDGRVETVVETTIQGEDPITLELRYLRISSVLLPSWNSSGKDGPIDMERRLANFREAQAVLDREAAGAQRSVLTDGGRLLGMTGGDGVSMRMVAGQCDVFRAAVKEQAFLYGSTLLLTLAVICILSAFLSKKVTEPVEQLCRDSRKGRCREDGPVTELNALAAAFNAA